MAASRPRPDPVTRPTRRSRAEVTRRDNTLSAVTSIRRLVRVLRVAAQRTHTATGISAAQLFVLQQLEPGHPLSLRELAARTFTDRSSVASVVERLQEQGFVRRTPDAADRRRAAVHITAAGQRIQRGATEVPMTTLVTSFRKLTAQELSSLATSLRRLMEALGASHEPASLLFNDAGAGRRRSRPRRRDSRSAG